MTFCCLSACVLLNKRSKMALLSRLSLLALAMLLFFASLHTASGARILAADGDETVRVCGACEVLLAANKSTKRSE